MISCILLSAGKSSRFGSPKACVQINNQTLIEQHLKKLLKTQLIEIIIVLGSQAELIEPCILEHKRVKVVHNKDWKFGQTSSFQKGINSISSESEAVLLLPVDFPNIKIDTFNDLINSYRLAVNKNPIIIPTFQGKKGHPPIFSNYYTEEISRLNPSQGINTIQQKYSNKILEVAVSDQAILQTFNTIEELNVLLENDH